MNEELIKDIFITIAFKAMDSGKEIRLEKGKNTSKSSTLGGAFSESSTDDYDSLSLLVYESERHEDLAEEDEEGADEDET